MADKYVFENEDSDDQKAVEEEQTNLAARDTWVGSILNSPFCALLTYYPKFFLNKGRILAFWVMYATQKQFKV